MGWLPLVVGLQLLFLYLAQGGPEAFLRRLFGQEEQFQDGRWGGLQVGMPISLVMSFPVLIVLTLCDRWLSEVGLLEIALVQGAYWLWLMRQNVESDAQAGDLDGPNPAPRDSGSADDHALPQADGSPLHYIGLESRGGDTRPGTAVSIHPGVSPAVGKSRGSGSGKGNQGAAGPTAPISLAPTCPGGVYAWSDSTPHAPFGGGRNESRAILDRLKQLYLWDDICVGRSFKEAWDLPNSRLVSSEDRIRFGIEFIEAMSSIARHSVALFRYGADICSISDILSAHPVDGFDEYSADLMQRLTYSVLTGRQKLFIDQTDMEIFGEDLIECLFRVAIFEVRATIIEYRPAGGGIQATCSPSLQ